MAICGVVEPRPIPRLEKVDVYVRTLPIERVGVGDVLPEEVEDESFCPHSEHSNLRGLTGLGALIVDGNSFEYVLVVRGEPPNNRLTGISRLFNAHIIGAVDPRPANPRDATVVGGRDPVELKGVAVRHHHIPLTQRHLCGGGPSPGYGHWALIGGLHTFSVATSKTTFSAILPPRQIPEPRLIALGDASAITPQVTRLTHAWDTHAIAATLSGPAFNRVSHQPILPADLHAALDAATGTWLTGVEALAIDAAEPYVPAICARLDAIAPEVAAGRDITISAQWAAGLTQGSLAPPPHTDLARLSAISLRPYTVVAADRDLARTTLFAGLALVRQTGSRHARGAVDAFLPRHPGRTVGGTGLGGVADAAPRARKANARLTRRFDASTSSFLHHTF
jgi:hypothetical protein